MLWGSRGLWQQVYGSPSTPAVGSVCRKPPWPHLLVAALVLCLLSLNVYPVSRMCHGGRMAACSQRVAEGLHAIPTLAVGWEWVWFQPWLMENIYKPNVGSCLMHKLLPWGSCRWFPDVSGAKRLSSSLRCGAASALRSLPCLRGGFAIPLYLQQFPVLRSSLLPRVNTGENHFGEKNRFSGAEVCQPLWER